MRPELVALTGLAGSGKSTAALGLVKNHGWMRVSFAETLRSMLLALGVTPQELHAKTIPIDWLGGLTSRQLLQSLGTEWGRELVSPQIWVEATRRRILAIAGTGGFPGIILDDCRFDNEAQMIHELGGAVIKIERQGLVRMAHASENGVSDNLIDQVISNNSDSLEMLQAALAREVFRTMQPIRVAA